MSTTFELIQDTISANRIPANAAFLQWKAILIPVHWAVVVETAQGDIRLSMKSRKNKGSGERVVFVFKQLSHVGKSNSVVYKETYPWKGPAVTIQKILEFVFALGWYR
ncbi:hypothetical protein QQS21_000079 [Conoideocrella luteorostrata]|uniref:Uncharacterized protein n=1 Tax=Conoideocrella luteorostrata TaxID=1105319 RepID=A0AAJ0D0A7_9HYPO|nr:hypothetical protein QQS21_000079 [Conoideocrella luteorostrata]